MCGYLTQGALYRIGLPMVNIKIIYEAVAKGQVIDYIVEMGSM